MMVSSAQGYSIISRVVNPGLIKAVIQGYVFSPMILTMTMMKIKQRRNIICMIRHCL